MKAHIHFCWLVSSVAVKICHNITVRMQYAFENENNTYFA